MTSSAGLEASRFPSEHVTSLLPEPGERHWLHSPGTLQLAMQHEPAAGRSGFTALIAHGPSAALCLYLYSFEWVAAR